MKSLQEIRFAGLDPNGSSCKFRLSEEIIENLYETDPVSLLHIKNELRFAIQESLEGLNDRYRYDKFNFTDFSEALEKLDESRLEQRVVRMIMYYEKFSTRNGMDDELLRSLR